MTDKEKEERTCAECFLRWYGQWRGANFALRRVHEVYPDLKGKKDWDFVAIANDDIKDRCAIEVKRLIRPQIRIQKNNWGTMLREATENLSGSLRGSFLVFPMVALNPCRGTQYHVLNLDHREWPRFKYVLTDVIGKSAAAMKVNETVDLGPRILCQFRTWPLRLRNACQLELRKVSDNGCSVRLGSVWDTFWAEEALREAVNNLDMSTQLALAKQRGIEQTTLLLDCRIGWFPDTVKQVIRDKDLSSCSADSIYLVEVSTEKICKVWFSGDGTQ